MLRGMTLLKTKFLGIQFTINIYNIYYNIIIYCILSIYYILFIIKWNVINNKKNFALNKKLQKINNPKEAWQTLKSRKSLDMPSKGVRKSKIPLNENREVCFNSKNNANTFCRFLSNLADSLLQKLSHPDLLTKFIN